MPRLRCFKAKAGTALGQAIDEVLADIKHLGGDGGIIAVSSLGEIEMRYNTDGMKRGSVDHAGNVLITTFDK